MKIHANKMNADSNMYIKSCIKYMWMFTYGFLEIDLNLDPSFNVRE